VICLLNSLISGNLQGKREVFLGRHLVLLRLLQLARFSLLKVENDIERYRVGTIYLPPYLLLKFLDFWKTKVEFEIFGTITGFLVRVVGG
jgi:hypothetical protein